MTDPIQVTPPADLVTLEEAKAQIRELDDFEDGLIEAKIAAAVAWMDGWRGILGRCILTQTWSFTTDRLGSMTLPFPDVQSAVVKYLDAAGVEQTVDSAQYRVRTIRGVGHLTFNSDFNAPALLAGRDDAVTVEAVFGLATAPPPIKQAALALTAHMLRNREGQDGIPPQVEDMIAPYRVAQV